MTASRASGRLGVDDRTEPAPAPVVDEGVGAIAERWAAGTTFLAGEVGR